MHYWRIKKPNRKIQRIYGSGWTLGQIMAMTPPGTNIEYYTREGKRVERKAYFWIEPDFNPDEWE
tara:strand:- start:1339 stop:1533 length:195 start_codon:yes stop_codon:yes gene_type:complete